MKLIFDVDGTLMDVEHRRHFVSGPSKDWDSFMDPKVMEGDSPNQPVVDIALAMAEAGHEIVVVSARNERHREVTESQLNAAGVQFQHLFLRPDGDFRSDDMFKEEVLDALIANDWKPDMVFDDRDQVVAMWRRRGLVCVQVAKGDF
jgi:phosphoglycolate phosphatase-like HAD superfamily hydrolase